MDVSIIIPTYNRAPLLEQALNSVVDQTYTNWECIVVDDGSTDDTESVVAEFGPDVRYLRQANKGPAVARNRGLQHAEGESVLFLDSDDLLLPEALETLVAQLDQKPEAGVAYGGYYGILENGLPGDLPDPLLPPGPYSSPWPTRDVRPHGLTASGQVFPELIKYDCILMGTALLRRRSVEKGGGFDSSLDLMEHWDFYLRLARRGVRFAAVEEPVLLLRMHGDSLSSDFEKMLRCRLDIIDHYLPPKSENSSGGESRAEIDSSRHESLRAEARARAFDFLGGTILDSGDLKNGLRQLQKALSLRSLPLERYEDLAIAFWGNAYSMSEQSARRFLRVLEADRYARSFRHYLLGRFLQAKAKLRARDITQGSSWTWETVTDISRQAGLSFLHLAGAVACRPELIGMYAKLFKTKLSP